MTWVAFEGDEQIAESETAWGAMEIAEGTLQARPEYRATEGKLSRECITKTEYELWYLPFDHGATRDTGVRVVLLP